MLPGGSELRLKHMLDYRQQDGSDRTDQADPTKTIRGALQDLGWQTHCQRRRTLKLIVRVALDPHNRVLLSCVLVCRTSECPRDPFQLFDAIANRLAESLCGIRRGAARHHSGNQLVARNA